MSGRRDTGFPGQLSSIKATSTSGRRDTGFPGQQSSIKAPSSSISQFRTIDELGNNAPDKVAVPTSFGGKFQGGLSERPTAKPTNSSTRRDTGFPGQGTGIPHYKTALGIPQKESRGKGVQNQEADSSVIETAEKKTVAAEAPRGKRRDTGMVFQPRNASYFGQRKAKKVHGSETPSQHVASSEARANALPVIGENVQRFRRSEFGRKVQSSQKSQYVSKKKFKLKDTLKSAAGTARASMFSASRRVVSRMSMLMFSEDNQKVPGKMTFEDDMQLAEYTMEEIRKHNTDESAWIVLHGRVYDVTKWMWYHPGREEVLQQNAGEDATFKFESNYHSNYARDTARKYVIGKVKDGELGDLHYNVPEKPTKKGFFKGLSGRETILVVILAIVILRAITLSFNE